MADDSETLEQFYHRRFEWLPEILGKDIGHVNVFSLPHPVNRPIPYRKRDYFKVTLCKGQSRIHYADEVFQFDRQALVFSNPFIPYKWEHIGGVEGGFYVIFNATFFHQFGNLLQYEVFQPAGTHVYEVDDHDYLELCEIYKKIEQELSSDYIHKYDVVRNLVYELIHYAMKTRPSTKLQNLPINASQRIYWLFAELLERQFPIDENHNNLILGKPSDFAQQLNVHVNHLNRAVKQVSGQTTTQLIADRIINEARMMLKQSKWNISEIAYALGFKEVSHFNYFFKKLVKTSPSAFRSGKQH